MLYDGTNNENYHNDDTKIDGTLTIGGYTLPSTDGTNNQVLVTDGLGVVSWATEVGVGDVNFTGTAPVSVNEICAYNNTNGLEIKQTGISATGGHLYAQQIDPPAVQNFYLGATNSTTTYISRAGQSTVLQGISVHAQKAEFLSNVEASNIYEYGLNNGVSIHNDLKVNTIRERTGSNGVSFVNTINANTINEYTPASGITLNNVLKVNEIEERTNPSGLTCNSVFKVDTIQEKTLGSGVLVDDVLHKDGGIRVLAGGLGNPTLSYAADPTVGIFFTNFPSMNAVCQGSGLFVGTSTYLELQSAEVRVSNIVEKVATQGVQIEDLAIIDRSIDAKTSGTMTIGGAVQTALELGRSGITTSNLGILANTLGSATNPSYTFTGDLDTGIYSQGADTISFTTAGVRKMAIGGSTIIYQPLNIQPSNAGSNPISLVANSNDILSFQTTTNNVFQITNSTNAVAFNGTTNFNTVATNFNNGLKTNTITGLSGTTMNIGTSVSTSVSIGATGIDTTINGNLVWAGPHAQGYYGTLATQGTATTTCTNANQDYIVAYGGGFVATDQISMTVSTNGLITYTGTKTRMFHTSWTISQTDNSNTVNKYSVFKNGAVVEGSTQQVDDGTSVGSTSIHIMMSLATGDTLQLYVRSASAGNIITLRQTNAFCMAMTN